MGAGESPVDNTIYFEVQGKYDPSARIIQGPFEAVVGICILVLNLGFRVVFNSIITIVMT